jgi:hypothetical protein
MSQMLSNLSIVQQVRWLEKDNHLALRLSEHDKESKKVRIYVMGCGRSGTWLLTALFSTFRDTTVISEEIPVQFFGIIKSNTKTLVLKRDFRSWQRVEEIPQEINIAWIVRHPYDVLTSHNPSSGREYHIDPYRWLGEMEALRFLHETRKNFFCVRYEDLVMNPSLAQARIASFYGLSVQNSYSEIAKTFSASFDAIKAMHGQRPIDIQSINRFRHDEKKITRLKKLLPRMKPLLSWVGEAYGYSLDI